MTGLPTGTWTVPASGSRGFYRPAGKLVIGSGFATATFSGLLSATHDDPAVTNICTSRFRFAKQEGQWFYYITTSHPVTIVGGVGYRPELQRCSRPPAGAVANAPRIVGAASDKGGEQRPPRRFRLLRPGRRKINQPRSRSTIPGGSTSRVLANETSFGVSRFRVSRAG